LEDEGGSIDRLFLWSEKVWADHIPDTASVRSFKTYRGGRTRWPKMFTIAPAAALFSGVDDRVDTAQAYTRAFAENDPGAYKNEAAYRASRLVVARVMMNPVAAAASAQVM
jgi:hypothetical protein